MYEIIFPNRVEKELGRLREGAYERVLQTIRNLAEEPQPRGTLKMSGSDFWRVRVGDYRIIYAIDDSVQQVTILRIAHRREVYR